MKDSYEKIAKHALIDHRLKTDQMRAIVNIVDTVINHEDAFNSREEILEARSHAIAKAFEAGLLKPIKQDFPEPVKKLWNKDGLRSEQYEFESQPDGNTVKISFIRPDSDEILPCVYYIHGGGMASGSCFEPTYQMWGRVLAKNNVAVAMVDFRNSEIPSMLNMQEVAPFPAGLNDCYSGLLFVHSQKQHLGIDQRIVVAGESGGGNLTLATALKCKQEGRMDLIQHGLYALCPYIAGNWPSGVLNDGKLGTSHVDNQGIFLSLDGNQTTAMGYGIDAFRARNPLAWPSFASVDDLVGLPRCTIVVNEFDPLRDEGILFYRKLLKARVNATCIQSFGTLHGSELMVPSVPDLSLSCAASIAAFVAASPELVHALATNSSKL